MGWFEGRLCAHILREEEEIRAILCAELTLISILALHSPLSTPPIIRSLLLYIWHYLLLFINNSNITNLEIPRRPPPSSFPPRFIPLSHYPSTSQNLSNKMPLTIREIGETGQERACYVASGGGDGGGKGDEGEGRVDVIVSFLAF